MKRMLNPRAQVNARSDVLSRSVRGHWLHRAIFTTSHHAVGRLYLYLALLSVAIGTLLSVFMRLHLTWPDRVLPFHGPVLPEDYLALVTIH